MITFDIIMESTILDTGNILISVIWQNLGPQFAKMLTQFLN